MAIVKEAVEWEIVDHGMMLSDYFGGCGVCFSSYEDCYTGVGDNPREALMDAINIAEDCQWDCSRMDAEAREMPEVPSVSAIQEETKQDMEDVYYFVSIRLLSFNPNRRQ